MLSLYNEKNALKNLKNKTFLVDKTSNQVRIIGGNFRGQKITFSNNQGLRPTGSRIKETLFNWLALSILDSNCLDLFAGSGSLGIESISRGAKSVTMIEKSRSAFAAIKNSCSRLGIKDVSLVETDSMGWLTHKNNLKSFDVVFLDPPFDSDLISSCCELLEKNLFLAKSAYIYIETTRNHPIINVPDNWKLLRGKNTGQVAYKLYLRN